MSPDAIAGLRERLAQQQRDLAEHWHLHRDAPALLQARASGVTAVLKDLWQRLALPEELALVAVGGFGRGELFPYSDVDLLLLLPDDLEATRIEAPLQALFGTLWDIGLEIGHSVRTVDECLSEARNDITIRTALLEAHLIIGNQALYERFSCAYQADFEPGSFIKAKQLEQVARHAKHADTPFALEPNCKESPGGLRDLHVVLWCARGAGIGAGWTALADAGVLRLSEARQLAVAERRLQELRIELHLLLKRREERLLFDVQEKIAATMGIAADGPRRASEVLMQRYYRNARRVTLLTSLVLPAIAAQIDPDPPGAPIIIDDEFQTVRDALDIRHDDVFERKPGAILECFRLQMARNELRGLTPRTQRALWHARHQIDDAFRADPAHRAAFIDLFRQRHLVRALRRMNQFNILGRYLPAFGEIVGRMQHDLFHVYTVDQHILQVVRNLRRFAMPEFAHEYPFCSRLLANFEKPWLLYIAALFHDIAKGRGGDHSKLGMADARTFCGDHGLDAADTALVVFLVEHHLTMSTVAQKQDLTDPDVVAAFTRTVADPLRLTALYLLTVADIRGTSPKVWNSWKAKLLEDLFRLSMARLQGETSPGHHGLAERQDAARAMLALHGLRPGVEQALWSQLDTGYFMRHEAEIIAWHARTLYHCVDSEVPVVKARLDPKVDGIQVMVYVTDQTHLFARLCHVFARLGFNIADAKVHTTRHGYALDTFVVLTPGGESYRDTASLLEHDLSAQLQSPGTLPAAPSARLSRQVRHFPITPEIEIRPDERGGHHIMALTAADRSGLLYAVALILAQHEIQLHSARITTLGERVEDMFLISGKRLENPVALVRLEQDLLAALKI